MQTKQLNDGELVAVVSNSPATINSVCDELINAALKDQSMRRKYSHLSNKLCWYTE